MSFHQSLSLKLTTANVTNLKALNGTNHQINFHQGLGKLQKYIKIAYFCINVRIACFKLNHSRKQNLSGKSSYAEGDYNLEALGIHVHV